LPFPALNFMLESAPAACEARRSGMVAPLNNAAFRLIACARSYQSSCGRVQARVSYPRRLKKVIDPLRWIPAFLKRELS
jgi:hypothetical protein